MLVASLEIAAQVTFVWLALTHILLTKLQTILTKMLVQTYLVQDLVLQVRIVLEHFKPF